MVSDVEGVRETGFGRRQVRSNVARSRLRFIRRNEMCFCAALLDKRVYYRVKLYLERGEARCNGFAVLLYRRMNRVLFGFSGSVLRRRK